MSGALASPAFAQSLESIVRHADLIVQAHVSDIGIELDKYNSPIEVITLEISDAVVGNMRNGDGWSRATGWESSR